MHDSIVIENWCKANGVSSAGLKALAIAVCYGIAYRYRRGKYDNFQYEIEIPGYGRPAKKTKWQDVTIWGVVPL